MYLKYKWTLFIFAIFFVPCVTRAEEAIGCYYDNKVCRSVVPECHDGAIINVTDFGWYTKDSCVSVTSNCTSCCSINNTDSQVKSLDLTSELFSKVYQACHLQKSCTPFNNLQPPSKGSAYVLIVFSCIPVTTTKTTGVPTQPDGTVTIPVWLIYVVVFSVLGIAGLVALICLCKWICNKRQGSILPTSDPENERIVNDLNNEQEEQREDTPAYDNFLASQQPKEISKKPKKAVNCSKKKLTVHLPPNELPPGVKKLNSVLESVAQERANKEDGALSENKSNHMKEEECVLTENMNTENRTVVRSGSMINKLKIKDETRRKIPKAVIHPNTNLLSDKMCRLKSKSEQRKSKETDIVMQSGVINDRQNEDYDKDGSTSADESSTLSTDTNNPESELDSSDVKSNDEAITDDEESVSDAIQNHKVKNYDEEGKWHKKNRNYNDCHQSRYMEDDTHLGPHEHRGIANSNKLKSNHFDQEQEWVEKIALENISDSKSKDFRKTIQRETVPAHSRSKNNSVPNEHNSSEFCISEPSPKLFKKKKQKLIEKIAHVPRQGPIATSSFKSTEERQQHAAYQKVRESSKRHGTHQENKGSANYDAMHDDKQNGIQLDRIQENYKQFEEAVVKRGRVNLNRSMSLDKYHEEMQSRRRKRKYQSLRQARQATVFDVIQKLDSEPKKSILKKSKSLHVKNFVRRVPETSTLPASNKRNGDDQETESDSPENNNNNNQSTFYIPHRPSTPKPFQDATVVLPVKPLIAKVNAQKNSSIEDNMKNDDDTHTERESPSLVKGRSEKYSLQVVLSDDDIEQLHWQIPYQFQSNGDKVEEHKQNLSKSPSSCKWKPTKHSGTKSYDSDTKQGNPESTEYESTTQLSKTKRSQTVVATTAPNFECEKTKPIVTNSSDNIYDTGQTTHSSEILSSNIYLQPTARNIERNHWDSEEESKESLSEIECSHLPDIEQLPPIFRENPQKDEVFQTKASYLNCSSWEEDSDQNVVIDRNIVTYESKQTNVGQKFTEYQPRFESFSRPIKERHMTNTESRGQWDSEDSVEMADYKSNFKSQMMRESNDTWYRINNNNHEFTFSYRKTTGGGPFPTSEQAVERPSLSTEGYKTLAERPKTPLERSVSPFERQHLPTERTKTPNEMFKPPPELQKNLIEKSKSEFEHWKTSAEEAKSPYVHPLQSNDHKTQLSKSPIVNKKEPSERKDSLDQTSAVGERQSMSIVRPKSALGHPVGTQDTFVHSKNNTVVRSLTPVIHARSAEFSNKFSNGCFDKSENLVSLSQSKRFQFATDWGEDKYNRQLPSSNSYGSYDEENSTRCTTPNPFLGTKSKIHDSTERCRTATTSQDDSSRSMTTGPYSAGRPKTPDPNLISQSERNTVFGEPRSKTTNSLISTDRFSFPRSKTPDPYLTKQPKDIQPNAPQTYLENKSQLSEINKSKKQDFKFTARSKTPDLMSAAAKNDKGSTFMETVRSKTPINVKSSERTRTEQMVLDSLISELKPKHQIATINQLKGSRHIDSFSRIVQGNIKTNASCVDASLSLPLGTSKSREILTRRVKDENVLPGRAKSAIPSERLRPKSAMSGAKTDCESLVIIPSYSERKGTKEKSRFQKLHISGNLQSRSNPNSSQTTMPQLNTTMPILIPDARGGFDDSDSELEEFFANPEAEVLRFDNNSQSNNLTLAENCERVHTAYSNRSTLSKSKSFKM